MNFLSRYKLMNGGMVMLCRRFLGIWFDYQPHRNRIHEVETKMNTKVGELRKLHEQRRDLLAEERRIQKHILESRECQSGYGVPLKMKLPLFPWRCQATPPPAKDWEPHSRIFDGKGARSVAEMASGSNHHSIVSVNGQPNSGSEPLIEGEIVLEDEILGAHDWDLNPRRNNNQRKKQNNNQQQQNNNGNQNNN